VAEPETPEGEETQPQPRPRRRYLLWTGVVLLVVALSAAVWLYFELGLWGPRTKAPPSAHTASAPAHRDKPKGEALYVGLEPPFVVNFEVERELHFLQTSLVVMVHDQAAADMIQRHLPRIRNNVIMLLAGETFARISTAEGRQRLRTQLLEEVNSVLRDVSNGTSADAVYITNFVMQ
jgi:flagellar FliL protein